jgi:hypothetical protein
MSRLRQYRISSELLVHLLQTGHEMRVRVKQGLPADAIALRVVNRENYFALVVWSEQFAEAEDGKELPVGDGELVFETIP